jgi:hypothetical protein
MIKIDKLVIEKFRAFSPNTEIHIGKNLTLIAGQNGTAKSTILGMLGQPLGIGNARKAKKSLYTNVYHKINLNEIKTIGGKSFSTDYSEVFRISKKTDAAGDHRYQVFLSGDTLNEADPPSGILNIESEPRDTGSKIRFVTNTKNRKSGAGNFPHPVIYLGLQRLMPLCLEDVFSIETNGYSDDERDYFLNSYKQILIITDEEVSPERIQPAKGNYFTGATTQYDSEALSSGQDNIGQIITSIISLRRLKKTLGAAYQGGLLLIDEIDASLHPVSQEKLVDYLLQESKDLGVQVVATTHSLFILDEFRGNKSIDLIYLKKHGNDIVSVDNPSYELIYSDLALKLSKVRPKKVEKVTVWVEDSTGSNFYKTICGNLFKQYVNLEDISKSKNAGLPNNFLIHCSDISNGKNLIHLKDIVFLVDGDSKDAIKGRKHKNLLMLPGETCIEQLMYKFLKTLPSTSKFWTKKTPLFNHQQCFRDFTSEPTSTTEFKKWFSNNSSKGVFGNQSNYLFKEWLEVNKVESKRFCNEFLGAILSTPSGKTSNINKRELVALINKKFT